MTPCLPDGVDPVGVADEPEVWDGQLRALFVEGFCFVGDTNEVEIEIQRELGVLSWDDKVDLSHKVGVFPEVHVGVDKIVLHHLEVDLAGQALCTIFDVEEFWVFLALSRLRDDHPCPSGACSVLSCVTDEQSPLFFGETCGFGIGHGDVCNDRGGLLCSPSINFFHGGVVKDSFRAAQCDG